MKRNCCLGPACSHSDDVTDSWAVAGSLLEVIDPAGRLCYSILPAAGSTTISVDMRALPKGLYTLRLSTPAGSCIRKLMRQ